MNEQIKEKTELTEKIIKAFLPKVQGLQKTVIDAMNYSFTVGGKRLRPMILMETGKYYGAREELLAPFMAALEMIHTYSLVHDDLPEMDNDELRRGMPTTHIQYGQDMAVLAGDGLLNYAFETAVKAFDVCKDAKEISSVIRALKVLGNKAGIYGMIGGQTFDVESEKKGLQLQEDEILFIHRLKTGALLQIAFMVGAILAGAPEEEIQKLERIGEHVGIAFQIQDDILDVIGSTEELGKPVGSDCRNEKCTYVSIMGLEHAKERQTQESHQAVELLTQLKGEGDLSFLQNLVLSLITRTK